MAEDGFTLFLKALQASNEARKPKPKPTPIPKPLPQPKRVPPPVPAAYPLPASQPFPVNDDYTGAVCLLHKLTIPAPVYEEILVEIADFEELIAQTWRIDRTNSRAKYKYVMGSAGRFLHIHLMNPPRGMIVDHVFHNTLDNRRSKLRVVTPRDNVVNSRPKRGGSSRYKGVFRCGPKWHVRAGPRGQRVFIGSFDSEIDAARAYNEFAKRLYGSMAYQNPL